MAKRSVSKWIIKTAAIIWLAVVPIGILLLIIFAKDVPVKEIIIYTIFATVSHSLIIGSAAYSTKGLYWEK